MSRLTNFTSISIESSHLLSVTGGGEKLSFIEFDYGSAVISAEKTKKIGMIGKAQ